MFAFYPKNNADPIEKEAIILRSVLTLMDKVHFKPKDINDDFSKKIYKNFLTTLDGGKRFLTQSRRRASQWRVRQSRHRVDREHSRLTDQFSSTANSPDRT